MAAAVCAAAAACACAAICAPQAAAAAGVITPCRRGGSCVAAGVIGVSTPLIVSALLIVS